MNTNVYLKTLLLHNTFKLIHLRSHFHPTTYTSAGQPFTPTRPETESILSEGNVFNSISFEDCLPSTGLLYCKHSFTKSYRLVSCYTSKPKFDNVTPKKRDPVLKLLHVV